jgi:hypothetical protein
MTSGRVLAIFITLATAVFIVTGAIWPIDSATAMAGTRAELQPASRTPEAAVGNLLNEVEQRNWETAYSSLANQNEFSETEFERDLTGSYQSLRSYSTLDSFDLHPVHASADQAEIRASLRWSSVVGTFQEVRDLRVQRSGDRWQVAWPIVKEARVPPQVIPVNYLRWDVIYRGAGDDWGSQDVEQPHIRIVDMHPVDLGGGVIVMGELLNEDVVPAFVTVKATLLAKDGSALATEDAFDKISHTLLPKQVTPFRIDFHNVRLRQVASIRMAPSSSLIPASADPVIEVEEQKLSAAPDAALSAKLVNQGGQVVNIARVLGTFYDATGQLVWVSGEYADRALLPQTPVPISISLPADIAGKVSTYRVMTSTYSFNRSQ